MIKAVIFDCFGVLATEAWLPFKAKYFGRDPQLMAEVNDISEKANKGLISRLEAIQATAELAGMTASEALNAIDQNVPNEELFTYIRQLKKDYKIGLLSNISSNRLHIMFESVQLSLFDAISLSYEQGFIKPQAQAFEIAAKQLGVKPEECVLIDDQERNVTGAQATGMKAVLYKDVEQLKRDLGGLLEG